MDLLVELEQKKDENVFTITPQAQEYFGLEYEISVFLVYNVNQRWPLAILKGTLMKDTVLKYRGEPVSHYYYGNGENITNYEVILKIGGEEIKKEINF